MLERLTILLINIFLPPLSILLLTSPTSPDFLLNTLLFILGVLPGHIHAFYLSTIYFHRKSKVRKGVWPGGKKTLVYSREIENGGASEGEVRELWRVRCLGEEEKRRGKGSKKGDGGRRVNTGRRDEGGIGEDRSWDGRRESKRVSTRMSTRAGSEMNGHGTQTGKTHWWR